VQKGNIVEWISVKDRLPEKGTYVLTYDGLDMNLARFTGEDSKYYWDCDTYGMYDYDVTHWMPLPPPPKE
jgi:hypothetical protein